MSSPQMFNIPYTGFRMAFEKGEQGIVWNGNQGAPPMGNQTISIVNNNYDPAVAMINAAMQADAIRQRGNRTMSAVRS